jgi:hypothetical protein
MFAAKFKSIYIFNTKVIFGLFGFRILTKDENLAQRIVKYMEKEGLSAGI